MASYESKMSVAFFDCPQCIDNFGFPWEKIRNLAARLACHGSLPQISLMLSTFPSSTRATQCQQSAKSRGPLQWPCNQGDMRSEPPRLWP